MSDKLVEIATFELAKKAGFDLKICRCGGFPECICESHVIVPTQTTLHRWIMDKRGVLISIYNNACGFLWVMMKFDGGTDLGYSEYSGNCPESGAYLKYEDALEDALRIELNSGLKLFQKETKEGQFHWSNYARYAIEKYKKS